jgi:hypothetical protein
MRCARARAEGGFHLARLPSLLFTKVVLVSTCLVQTLCNRPVAPSDASSEADLPIWVPPPDRRHPVCRAAAVEI